MKVFVEYEGVRKEILCDESCDCIHAKELACCEFNLSPAFTRIYFNGKILLGEEIITNLGIEEGSVIQVQTASLR